MGMTTELPRRLFLMKSRGFEIVLSERDDAVAFGMKKKLKTIFAGVSG